MAKCADISAAKLRAKVGRTLDVILDAVDEDGGATGRSKADAPEIDGNVLLRDAAGHAPGDILPFLVEDADEHGLYGVRKGGESGKSVSVRLGSGGSSTLKKKK